MLKYLFPGNRYYNLLKGVVYERFNRRPVLFREELMTADENELIIIDEVQKIPAWSAYTSISHELSYWRTASGFEVDLILGDAQVAIEIKVPG